MERDDSTAVESSGRVAVEGKVKVCVVVACLRVMVRVSSGMSGVADAIIGWRRFVDSVNYALLSSKGIIAEYHKVIRTQDCNLEQQQGA